MLLQVFFMDTFMVLPYWRRQKWYLSLMGPAGPVIGLLMHVREFGFGPPVDDDDAQRKLANGDAFAKNPLQDQDQNL